MAIVMTSNYSDDTEGARVCIEHALPWIDEACKTIEAAEWCFADYGAADGGTSLGLYRAVARAAGQRPVTFILNDLPGADWASLAANGQRAAEGRPDDVVYLASRSFYERITPPRRVDLGFSATAMHWLGEKRVHLPDHTHANAAPESPERAKIAEQAEHDWAHLMSRRLNELAPNGHFIAVNLAQNAHGHYLGHNGRDLNMHDVLHDIWRGYLESGDIDDGTYRRATFQNFYKTSEQFLAPLGAGWSVHKAEMKSVPCPYRARFDRDGDVERFASGLMRTVRSWSAHTFTGAFTRGDEHGLVDRLYETFQQRIAAEPTKYSMDYVQHYLWAQKDG